MQLTDHDGADGHAASGTAQHSSALPRQARDEQHKGRRRKTEAEAHILQEQGAVEDALARVPRLFHVASRSKCKSKTPRRQVSIGTFGVT